MVYDVTDRESFDSLTGWFSEVNRLADPNVSRILVGNKSDLTSERVVSYEEGAAFAKKCNIKFLESSAKTAFNVFDVFKTMTIEMIGNVEENILDTPKDRKINQNYKKVTLSSGKNGNSKCC